MRLDWAWGLIFAALAGCAGAPSFGSARCQGIYDACVERCEPLCEGGGDDDWPNIECPSCEQACRERAEACDER